MTIKSLPISFRLPVETKMALERAAAADTRSLSSLLEVIVKEWLKTKGQTTD